MRTWSNPFYLKVFGDFWRQIEEAQFINNLKPFTIYNLETRWSFTFPNVIEITGCNNYSSASNFDWHRYDFSC